MQLSLSRPTKKPLDPQPSQPQAKAKGVDEERRRREERRKIHAKIDLFGHLVPMIFIGENRYGLCPFGGRVISPGLLEVLVGILLDVNYPLLATITP